MSGRTETSRPRQERSGEPLLLHRGEQQADTWMAWLSAAASSASWVTNSAPSCGSASTGSAAPTIGSIRTRIALPQEPGLDAENSRVRAALRPAAWT